MKKGFRIFFPVFLSTFITIYGWTDSKTATSSKSKSTTQKQTTTRRYSSMRKKGSVPQKRSSSRSGGVRYGSTYKVPLFKLQANQNLPILHFFPSDRQVVAGGDAFSMLVILSNPQGDSFDKVVLNIRYDPAILQPVEYEDKLPREFMKNQPKMLVFQKEGIIRYQAEFTSPQIPSEDEIMAIKWKPLLPQKDSQLQFVRYQEEDTGIYQNGRNILGETAVPDDGTIPGSVSVISQELIQDEEEGEFLNRLIVDSRSEEIAVIGDGSVELVLRSPEDAVREGDIFLVDVFFRNPKARPIDNVNLDIRFDPEVLQVVDYDEENWVTRDVNIFDGDYHEVFPFDFHLKNKVFNQSGRIIYQMGISKSDILNREGSMATIKFYARKPSEKTMVRFFRPPVSTFGDNGTLLTHSGRDVLGDSEDPFAGLKNAEFTIYEKF